MASAGTGSIGHLVGEFFKMAAGVDGARSALSAGGAEEGHSPASWDDGFSQIRTEAPLRRLIETEGSIY
jgi:hypothetical protein